MLASTPGLSGRTKDRIPFALVLLAVVVAAFAPVLSAGFVNYDDPWLIVDNPFFAQAASDTPYRAFFDFSLKTRLGLGAEYLPVRDCLVWLETRAFGKQPEAMHAVSLAFYAVAVVALYQTLRRTLQEREARAAVLVFALHPVHVESVAWLSGQKDVFALCFGALALSVHARGGRGARYWTASLLLAACLSKSMSVVLVALLVVHDWLRQRPWDRWLYASCACVVLLCACLHVYVGGLVGMVAEPAAGSRLGAAMTMGPVFVRYLGMALFPARTSIVHDVPELALWCWPSAVGYALCAGWAALAVQRRSATLALGWCWFWLPLLPVCQIIVPLQNRMADRYLCWSILGPACVCAGTYVAACQQIRSRWVAGGIRTLGVLGLLSLGLLSFERSVLFTDSVLLFSDALPKAPLAPLAPYQLGKAWEEERGDDEHAAEAFREALVRAEPLHDSATLPRAANNLARIYFRRGELDAAERVLVRASGDFPHNAKLRRNLAKVRTTRENLTR